MQHNIPYFRDRNVCFPLHNIIKLLIPMKIEIKYISWHVSAVNTFYYGMSECGGYTSMFSDAPGKITDL